MDQEELELYLEVKLFTAEIAHQYDIFVHDIEDEFDEYEDSEKCDEEDSSEESESYDEEDSSEDSESYDEEGSSEDPGADVLSVQ